MAELGSSGHEIGHGLTIKEVLLMVKVMRNWWTPQDLTSFKAKTKSLVDQYSAFKYFQI
jgi:putative endopeptidase